MVFKGCQRCKGDLWVEEDIGSRSRDCVCVSAGPAGRFNPPGSGPTIEDQTDATRWLMSQRPSRISAYGP